jgi:uncharacterized protein DUF3108
MINRYESTERRRRGLGLVAALMLLSVVCVQAQEPVVETADHTTPAAPKIVPFGPGEELIFDISYGPVHAGEASLKIRGVVDSRGVDCYHVESTAQSSRFFSAFYKVRDKVVSHFGVDDLVSRYFSKRLHEGEYRKNVQVRFDQQEHQAIYKDGRVIDVAPETHDILSAFYVVRTLPLIEGETTHVKTHSSKKNYDLEVIVHGRETVDVPAGTFDCVKVEPVILGEGLFQFEGQIIIWLTDDDRRIPVLMKTKVKIGAVDASLKSYTPGVLLNRREGS